MFAVMGSLSLLLSGGQAFLLCSQQQPFAVTGLHPSNTDDDTKTTIMHTTTCDDDHDSAMTRRGFWCRASVLTTISTTMVATTGLPSPAWARYMLDDDTGEYVEVQDKPWQDELKARLDKASSMSKDEIFEAARGAGNTNLKTGPESDASKKRRAVSACRDASVRSKLGLVDEKACTARVFAGDVDFVLEAL